MCCLDPWLFITAYEGLNSLSSFLSLGGCLSFYTLRMRLCAAVDGLANEHHVAQFLLLLQACGLCTLYCQPGTAAQAYVLPSLFPLQRQNPFLVNEALPVPQVRLLHCRCLAHVCRACHAVLDSDDLDGREPRAAAHSRCPVCHAAAPLDGTCARGCKHCTKRARQLGLLTPFLRVLSETATTVDCVPITAAAAQCTASSTDSSGSSISSGSSSEALVLPKSMVHCKRCFDVLQSEGVLKDDRNIGTCFYRVRVLNTDYTYSSARLLSMLVSRFSHALLVDGFTTHMTVPDIDFITPAYASFTDVYGNVVTLWVAGQVPYAVRRDPALSLRAMLGSTMDVTVYVVAKGFAPLRALDSFQLAFLGTVEPLCPLCALFYEEYGVELRPAAPHAARRGEHAEPRGAPDTADTGTGEPLHHSRPGLVCTARHHTLKSPAYFSGDPQNSA